jgi:hypothetical protein
MERDTLYGLEGVRSARVEGWGYLVVNTPEDNFSELVTIRAERSMAEWLKYVASALIVGGSTVALTFLLAGTVVHVQVYIALGVLYGVLLLAGGFLRWRINRHRDHSGSLLLLMLLPGVTAVYIGIITSITATHGIWPVRPYAAAWWELFAVALVVATLGAEKRRYAETRIEELKEEEQRLRNTVTSQGLGSQFH